MKSLQKAWKRDKAKIIAIHVTALNYSNGPQLLTTASFIAQ